MTMDGMGRLWTFQWSGTTIDRGKQLVRLEDATVESTPAKREFLLVN